MLSHLNSIFIYADLLQSDMLAAVIQDEASQVTQQPASVDKDALDNHRFMTETISFLSDLSFEKLPSAN